MIKEYKLIAAKGSNILSELVNEAIEGGWEPFNSPTVTSAYLDGKVVYQYAQAVVIYATK